MLVQYTQRIAILSLLSIVSNVLRPRDSELCHGMLLSVTMKRFQLSVTTATNIGTIITLRLEKGPHIRKSQYLCN